ncbi:hypothetical protein AMK21_08080 [Streptomyces sp. CB00316]|nr:hypothetical protein AMK21_08080 [Streptomyces sp. CB00316]
MRRVGALEGGVVVPPRYDLGDWQEGDGVFNAAATARSTPSPRCVGLNVTIYDPDPDPDGTAGALLADLVVGALAPA